MLRHNSRRANRNCSFKGVLLFLSDGQPFCLLLGKENGTGAGLLQVGASVHCFPRELTLCRCGGGGDGGGGVPDRWARGRPCLTLPATLLGAMTGGAETWRSSSPVQKKNPATAASEEVQTASFTHRGRGEEMFETSWTALTFQNDTGSSRHNAAQCGWRKSHALGVHMWQFAMLTVVD
ncbi:unnamed protein product [Merluccius merluccius]